MLKFGYDIPLLLLLVSKSAKSSYNLCFISGDFEDFTNHWGKAVSGGHYLRSVTGLSVFTCSLKVIRGKIKNNFNEYEICMALPLLTAQSSDL